MTVRFKALDYACPRCGMPAHKACKKLNNIGPTGYLRVPHPERRAITGEGVNGNPKRVRKAQL